MESRIPTATNAPNGVGSRVNRQKELLVGFGGAPREGSQLLYAFFRAGGEVIRKKIVRRRNTRPIDFKAGGETSFNFFHLSHDFREGDWLAGRHKEKRAPRV